MSRYGRAQPTKGILIRRKRILVPPFGPYNYYTTNFPATENPISEGGIWTSSGTTGLDWQEVQTTTNKAFGSQSGVSSVIYDDSTAMLGGIWDADQQGSGTVFRTNTAGDYHAEVEILLRWIITANQIRGYEVNFSCEASSTYVTIVRWDGSIGKFATLDTQFPGAVVDGDIVSAKIVGNTITGYINGVQRITATDSNYPYGNPGIGFYNKNLTGHTDSNTFGFKSYTARGLTTPGSVINSYIKLQAVHRAAAW